MQLEFAIKNSRVKGTEIEPFLRDKTSKLERHAHGPLHARWSIHFENDEHEAHLHVTGSNMDFSAKSKDHNLFTAIEDAVDKLDRQLSKHKEMLQDHHK